MGGRSSLPTPGERSNSDFSGPRSLLWSPWLELGTANYDTSLQLSINSELISKFSQLKKTINNQVTAAFLSNNFLTIFPFFPNEIPEYHSPEWILSGKISEQPQLYSLGTFKRLPRSFWVSCHLMSHLLWSHFLGGSWGPKCREVATWNIGSVWGCCHLSFSLHLVPSTSLTSKLLFTTLPCCCLQFLFINNKIFKITFHFFWLCWVISSYFSLNLT